MSSELTRILSHQGCEVVGLIIDDLLMRSPKCDGHGIATQRYNKARAIMDELGVVANDKSVPPCHDLVFTGLSLDANEVSVVIAEEHRQYTIDKIEHLLKATFVSKQQLQSLAGTLNWLCFVMPEGRPRRDTVFKAYQAD